MALIAVLINLLWIRTPHKLLQEPGFFFDNGWINYDRIKGMN
ncbi:DUF986 family protein [Mixta intestinalis]